MQKRWIISDQPHPQSISDLSAALNISTGLATLLVQRGIHSFDQAKDFFRPQLSQLHDPFLMKDMDKAVTRLSEALEQNERILIYGDYDVDGTTSVALVFQFLQQLGARVEYYIPDRYTEGYGVSQAGIEYAIQQGIALIISLDCGIKAHEKVAFAKTHGIDFIICDHHRPSDTLPDALAVLDAKRDDCPYPYKELSGCGVGFKLLQGLCMQNAINLESLYPFLDLVAISIASDIVPLTGENRIMAYYGLQKINTDPRPGVKALIELGGIRQPLNITSVVFGIGPRINAAGRIAHAHGAVKLLLSDTNEEALTQGERVNDRNSERKNFDSTITQEALNMIEENEVIREAKSTVLFKDTWHKGVIGIVASRCIEKYYRPTVILTESNNKATGSARSIPGFDLYEAIEECSDLLDQFGGHTYAAGLTLPIANIPLFQKRFEEVAQRKLTEELLTPQLEIDTELDFSKITEKFYRVLSQMEPFGPGNMAPVFISRHVTCYESPRLLKEQHLKLKLVQEGHSNILEAIAFGMGDLYPALCEADSFDIAYSIEQNEFKGTKTLQLNIKDIKV
ncbi:single-stranded-DNA-specific exonuclease RecJ [Cytophagales bacterium LB-30]|uniref:Single-stranded-DNA-specific exonuclease RecJ n=1 Tax=Shiella aurantiaca TaxID=3058365 RepID=A0ABT8F8H2_9BACT|nr:single-stranded-DNA-specific exonuclease RecJ [Shiella aurantiaca]MDN4166780.1 single-stranded-DNA-specific exonuclease RecJ [Shiella aurantiaca]